MKYLKSFLISMSIYTTIPMPKVLWEEKYMKYIFYMLPFTSIFLGFLEYGVFLFAEYYNLSSVFYAGLSTTLIVIYTGGFHLDGFADTVDAISSHGDITKRREILKDAHTGAFAVIYTSIYLLLLFSAFENMYKSVTLSMLLSIFILSRIFVLYLIAFMQNSNETGLLHTFSQSSNKKSLIIYLTVLLIFVLFFMVIYLDIFFAVILLLILLTLSIILYKYFNKSFGGLSGDLAGFGICVYELAAFIFCSIYWS